MQTLGAVHTTIMTATNVFLDLLSSPPESCYYESLREESIAAFKTQGEWEDLASLSRLSYTDSAIRESLRLNLPAARGAMRKVIHKDGLTLPGGHHLPQNAWVGASVVGVNTDDRYYKEPNQYEPFRFARARTELASLQATDPKNASTARQELNGAYLATTADTFMSFGYGRHSW